MLLQKFQSRIIEFDESAAMITGELLANNKRAGINSDVRDYQIAGIARMSGADIATRNVKDFIDLGIKIIDPWKA